MSGTVRVSTLESVFTADLRPFEQGAVKVETRKKDLKKDVDVKVGADTKGARAGMDRVEADAKALTAKDVVAHIDANISAATKAADKIRLDLKVLESMEPTPKVDADTAKARAKLDSIESSIKSLNGSKAKLEVIADAERANSELDEVARKAGEAGSKGGADAGKGLSDGIVGALVALPVAGTVVGIGVAIGKSIMDGLQVEVRSDRLQAMTGLDPVTVGRLARASGEAYASNWGESLDANMDTARLAVQSGLLDPESTARDSQSIISSLSGVSDILGEEIPRVSRATAQLLRTGLAKDAGAAFDIIVKGQQAGLNVSEDWLDTIDEYSTQWRKLGLTGPEALGLLSQAVKAGARDTDTAADALKEFAIRAVDGSSTTAAGFAMIGASAEDMSYRIQAGGPSASAALDETLDRLRAMEDPVARDAAAVALFGTKAEDMGAALYAMDLSGAVDQLGAVEGAAKTALDTLGDNAAGSIESAQRNIEVAADGIKGALAVAFNPQIEDFSTFVSENREAVMQFLLDLANGGFDVARAFVEFSATSTEAVGSFIGGPMADLADSIAGILDGMSFAGLGIPGAQDAAGDLRGFADGMRSVKDTTDDVAENMRTNLIENGLDPAQQRLNDIAIPMLAQAALHDATTALASDIDGLGYAADGATQLLDAYTITTGGTVQASTDLDTQIRAVRDALDEQITKGIAAGETQSSLTEQYDASRQALMDQLVAMGLTTGQAAALVAQYGLVPDRVDTVVTANTVGASAEIDRWVVIQTGRRVPITFYSATPGLTPYVQGYARGDIVPAMAAGDITTAAISPLPPGAQMVAPGRLRAVMGDRLDVDELYAPLDGSPRSWALLMEGLRRMPGVMPMADGGLLTSTASTGSSLVGLAIEGTLDLGDGLVGVMRGVVRSEISQAQDNRASALRAGVR